jgi:predicted aspartyl protease
MNLRLTSPLPLLFFVALLFFAQAAPVSAQQTGRHTSLPSRTSRLLPSIRFSVGQSSLKVPFDLVGNLILMKAQLNDSTPLWFIFDTGATHTVVDTEQAKTLNLKARGRITGTGSTGTAVASRVRGVSVTFSGVELLNQTIYTLPVAFLSAPFGRHIGGVIGNDIIGKFVVEIDYANQTLSFYEPASYRYSGAGENIPLVIEKDGNVFTRAQVKIEGRTPLTGKFEIDTGSTGSVTLNTPFVKKHRLLSSIKRSKQVNLGGVGGSAGAVTARINSIRLGRFELMNPIARFSQASKGDNASARYDGLLGGQIFSRFKMIVDLTHRRMILEPSARISAPFEDDMSGLELMGDGEGFSSYLIDDVDEGSPAAEAGVQGGDVLTAIDGRAASEFTLEEIRRMFKQDGREYALTLKRGDKIFEVRLKLRRLV